jgi:dTDP-4-dehydrorhamnose 3,5-epimerase
VTEFTRLRIPDLIEASPRKHGDHRGFFSETWAAAEWAEQGIDIAWVQDNQSLSAEAGTVRGLHYQAPPVAQDKLIRVIRGAIYDVALDIRKGSATYGQWAAIELSAGRWNQLLVPRGFAHGFMTLMPGTEVLYKVSAPYAPDREGAILWNDPALGINWPDLPPTLSPKDRVAAPFSEHVPVFK